jgi:L-amino acid N-acyltransferase YncA
MGGSPPPDRAWQRVANEPDGANGLIRAGRRAYGGAVIIREAVDADWERGIYPIYAAVMDEGKTYAFPEGQTADEARPWWMEPPPNHVVVAVAEQDGTILGSAKMGPNRPGRGAHIATASFIVDRAARGRGTGRALGEYLLGWCRARGFHGIQFNAVVETNEPAVHLWQALGFGILGTVPEAFDHPDHGLVGLHVMYRRC